MSGLLRSGRGKRGGKEPVLGIYGENKTQILLAGRNGPCLLQSCPEELLAKDTEVWGWQRVWR